MAASTEELAVRIAPGAAAVVFEPDGNLLLLVPHMDKGTDVPRHVLAATEAFVRLEVDKSDTMDSLATAFTARKT